MCANTTGASHSSSQRFVTMTATFPRISRPKRATAARGAGPLLLLALLFVPAHGSHAQGCSLCRDTTAGSAARAQAGLRRGIFLLGGTATLLLAAGASLAWHLQKRRDDS
jgi:hypothetical protein